MEEDRLSSSDDVLDQQVLDEILIQHYDELQTSEVVIDLINVVEILKLHGVTISGIDKDAILKRLNFVGTRPILDDNELIGQGISEEDLADWIEELTETNAAASSSNMLSRSIDFDGDFGSMDLWSVNTPFPNAIPWADQFAEQTATETYAFLYFKAIPRPREDRFRSLPWPAHECLVTLERPPILCNITEFYKVCGLDAAIYGEYISDLSDTAPITLLTPMTNLQAVTPYHPKILPDAKQVLTSRGSDPAGPEMTLPIADSSPRLSLAISNICSTDFSDSGWQLQPVSPNRLLSRDDWLMSHADSENKNNTPPWTNTGSYEGDGAVTFSTKPEIEAAQRMTPSPCGWSGHGEPEVL